MEPFSPRLRSGARAIVAGIAAALLLAGCTRPDAAELHTTQCQPREIQKAGIDGSLTLALARQAAENKIYRDCLERRSVRLAR